ncbi:MAG: hypothetical protein JO058_19675, partial [Alphaproteobacteria bacterium]|nr:hypothetical protein [Alphaproteobacteria bacterium]
NVAMLLIQLGGAPSARTPQTTEPPTAAAANPIHDKVNRYNVIEGINASIKSGDVPRDCRVVLVHYSQPYSETYAKEMKTLLELGLRWQVTDLLATTSLPQGISLRAIDKSQGKKCAEAMEIRLRNLTWRGGNLQAFADFVPVDNAPEYLRNCEQPCMEMDVGNEQ